MFASIRQQFPNVVCAGVGIILGSRAMHDQPFGGCSAWSIAPTTNPTTVRLVGHLHPSRILVTPSAAAFVPLQSPDELRPAAMPRNAIIHQLVFGASSSRISR